jgi:hypothetical protein
MRRDRPDPLTRWLDAEREDRADDAESALLELFELLPPLSPPAGFADRVLQRIALEAPAPAPGRLARLGRSWGFRLAVAFGLFATGVSLLWLPQVLIVLARVVTLSDMVELGVASVVDLGRWLAMAARIGEWLLIVGRALAVSLASAAALEVTTACLAISGISFVVLRDLMTRERSWSYVDPMQ